MRLRGVRVLHIFLINTQAIENEEEEEEEGGDSQGSSYSNAGLGPVSGITHALGPCIASGNVFHIRS